MLDKLKPALVGGLIAGILSLIPIVSTCCCIWAALGGFLASFMYIKSSPSQVTTGEGAIEGLLTGVVASLVYLVVQIPVALIFGVANIEDAFRRSGVDVPLGGLALMFLSAFLAIVLILIFSTIGGIVGVPVFEKRKAAQTPPPPENFGAGPGGPYGAAS